MTRDQAALALSILDPFRESSLYENYRREDGWTDAQFEGLVATLRAEAAASPTTAAELTTRESIDSDRLFEDWINGERAAVAGTFAAAGDAAATVRFALLLAGRCSPVVADQFGVLVDRESVRLVPTREAAAACIDRLAGIYAAGEHAPGCSSRRGAGECDCGRADVAGLLAAAGRGV
jgi:hypothetical protein